MHQRIFQSSYMNYIQISWFCAFYFAIPIVFVLHTVSGTSSLPIKKGLELNEEHNHVKTIKTQHGDIYDCVGLYKQPALSHPLLKHHKIQIRPTIAPQKEVSEKNLTRNSSAFGLNEGCPSGTVPIRRTTEEEKFAAKASFRQQFQESSLGNEQSALVFAGLSTPPGLFLYTDASGHVSTHNPSVDIQQLSASVLSIEFGPTEQFATIRVGWMANPSLYHDNRTRLYTLWSQMNAGERHGCFNTYCPGFVHTNPNIPLDKIIEDMSGLEGRQLYIFFELLQDSKTGNWWFRYGRHAEEVGYWPSDLFIDLKKGAETVRWGGMVLSTSQTLPDMGSGELGDPNGAHFRQISTATKFYKSSTSLNISKIANDPEKLIQSQTNCYKVGGNSYKGDYWGYSFWFGGKGGDVQHCKQ